MATMNEQAANDSETRQSTDEWLQIIWPETGLHTIANGPTGERDSLSADDEIELTIDFVTLSLSPLEFIQLASFMRMCVDNLLDRNPSYQRAVVNAFDIKD
jgi:hypothetical protein